MSTSPMIEGKAGVGTAFTMDWRRSPLEGTITGGSAREVFPRPPCANPGKGSRHGSSAREAGGRCGKVLRDLGVVGVNGPDQEQAGRLHPIG